MLRERLAAGRTVMMVAVEDGTPVAVGSHQPVDVDGTEVSEIVGVATLPRFRGRGLGAGIASALAAHARESAGMVFLAAGDDDVARVYERVGFARLATAAVAEQPTPRPRTPTPERPGVRDGVLLLVVGAHQDGPAERVHEQVEAEVGGAGVRRHLELLGVDGVHDEVVAVRAVPAGGAAPTNPAKPPSLRSCTAPSGSDGASSSPAPAGSSVTDAGMLATAQCQKPLAVGASGS